MLSPFVYWAQNLNKIYLKVDLKDVQNPEVQPEKKSIYFKATGKGAQGTQEYSFSLTLFDCVEASETNVKLNGNSININLTKNNPGWWPRLISTPQKPSWLKIDFDKWQSEDDLLEEKVNDIKDDYPDVYKNLLKNELGYLKEDFKRVYLVFYNICMLCGFLYAFIVMLITLLKEGSEYNKIYSSIGSVLCSIHLFQALEIMHAKFGYVKGSPLMPFMQIGGRLFVLFGNLEFEPRLQKMPAVTFLFFVWILSDLIRYLYYIFNMADSKRVTKKYLFPFMQWLRYSAWIILYPIGFYCEAVIVIRNMMYLHATPRWYLSLPNPYNFTFDYLTFLRIYILFIFAPGIYLLLKHMYRARVKHLGGHEPFDKVNIFKRKMI